MVAEGRGLLSGSGGEDHSSREYYTVQRLRALADEPLSAPERFCDLYLNLRALFHSLCDEEFAAALGLPPLNGELSDCARTSALSDAYLNSRNLLTAEPALHFPGEAFRVLKQKEEKQFGEYRTRRLVLEAWGRQEDALRRRGEA